MVHHLSRLLTSHLNIFSYRFQTTGTSWNISNPYPSVFFTLYTIFHHFFKVFLNTLAFSLISLLTIFYHGDLPDVFNFNPRLDLYCNKWETKWHVLYFLYHLAQLNHIIFNIYDIGDVSTCKILCESPFKTVQSHLDSHVYLLQFIFNLG